MSFRIALLVSLAAVLSSMTAKSQTLEFDFVGGTDASWTQSSDPASNFAELDGYVNVSVTQGLSGSNSFGSVYDYVYPDSVGGFAISTGGFTLIENGPEQIFTGSVNQPHFSVGTFTLTNGALTVTAVPETSTWALLLIGLGVIGVSCRRIRKSASVNAA